MSSYPTAPVVPILVEDQLSTTLDFLVDGNIPLPLYVRRQLLMSAPTPDGRPRGVVSIHRFHKGSGCAIYGYTGETRNLALEHALAVWWEVVFRSLLVDPSTISGTAVVRARSFIEQHLNDLTHQQRDWLTAVDLYAQMFVFNDIDTAGLNMSRCGAYRAWIKDHGQSWWNAAAVPASTAETEEVVNV